MMQSGTIFNAITATETRRITASPLGHATLARSIILEINGGDTPNWAVDIQGAYAEGATWHNIWYAASDTTPAALSVAQLTVNWTTAQYYVIPNPPPFVRLVATRTDGNLTVKGSFSSEAYSGIGLVASTVAGTVTANQGTAGAAAWPVYDAPQSIAGAATTQIGSTAEEDSLVVKASAGNLYGFGASSTVAGFIQVHNSTSLPADTAVPFQGNSYAITAGGTVTVAFDPPLRCATGIVLANSTTQNALTVATGDDTLFGAQYA